MTIRGYVETPWLQKPDWFAWPSTDIHAVPPKGETVFVKANGDAIPADTIDTALWIFE